MTTDLALWVPIDPISGEVTLEGCACEGTTAQLLLAAQAARERLFAISGYQFGRITETVRPYRQGRACGCGGYIPDYVGPLFNWSSWSGWSSFLGCGCGGPSYIVLAGDTTAISSVKVNGVTLVEDTDWILYDGMWLVKVSGIWPCCQDLTAPDTEQNTFSITYTHGPGVPAGGQIAAQALTCEYLKALTGDPTCALAGRIQSVSRDGVSTVILNPADLVAFRLTGIAAVDDWLMSIPRGSGTLTVPGLPSGMLRKTVATPAP